MMLFIYCSRQCLRIILVACIQSGDEHGVPILTEFIDQCGLPNTSETIYDQTLKTAFIISRALIFVNKIEVLV